VLRISDFKLHITPYATRTYNQSSVFCSLSSVFCHLSSVLYICREPSTNQLLFMQNKPNFLDTQMNANTFSKRAYENKHKWTLGENKPNSNPIKTNLKRAQMNINSLITKDYRKNDDFAVRKNKPNSNPISKKAKMNATAFSQKDYENEIAFKPQKNKPN